MVSADNTNRIRRSLTKTREAKTARLRFWPTALGGQGSFATRLDEEGHPTAAGRVRAVERAMERFASRLPVSTMSSPDGRIDFENRRSLYSAGRFWKLVGPGVIYVGKPGDWERAELAGVTLENPFWLFDVLETTQEAEESGRELVAGVECDRYDAYADFESAARSSTVKLMKPPGSDELDLGRLPASLWIDKADLVRRARLRCGDRITQLELSAFGETASIAFPGADEVESD